MSNQPYSPDRDRAARGGAEPYADRGGAEPYTAPGAGGGHPYAPNPGTDPGSFFSAGAGADWRHLFTGKDDKTFQFPWWAILIGFAVWWPLGFLFLGVNWFLRQDGNADRWNDRARQAARRAEERFARREERAAPPQNGQTPPDAAAPPKADNKPAANAKKHARGDAALVLTVLGCVRASPAWPIPCRWRFTSRALNPICLGTW